MRKVTYGAACSLDLFIARADGGVDWLLWCDEAAEYMTSYWKTIDTVVMGRKTYEFAKSQSGADSSYGVKSYVCSRTLPAGKDGSVEIVRDGVARVRELKRLAGKDICIMGGGDLAASLMEANLIDEIGVNIHPVLLGSGVPLLGPINRQVDLQRVTADVWENGCILATYRVVQK